MRPPSLRRRLILGVGAALIGVVVAFSATVLTVAHRSLTSGLDRSLEAKARALIGLFTYDDDTFEFEYVPALSPEFQRDEAPQYFQVWINNRCVARSRSLAGGDLPRSDGALELPDGRPGRLRVVSTNRVRVDHEADGPPPFKLTVAVARDDGPIAEPFQRLAALILFAGLAFAALSTLLAAAVVRRGLAPLQRLGKDIEKLSADALEPRLPDLVALEETGALVGKLNDFLDRLAAVRGRERAFSSDVAHELRSPLAALYATIEGALTRERSAEDYAAALEEAERLARPLISMVDMLLGIARLERGGSAEPLESIDLTELVEACWQSHAEEAERRALSFVNVVPAGLSIKSRPDMLILVFSNAFKNAVAYADQGGDLRAEARVDGEGLVLRLSNSGCRLNDEELALVFESFWRGDKARTRAGENFGLGLALVRKIMDQLGGRARAKGEDGRFILELSLPAGGA